MEEDGRMENGGRRTEEKSDEETTVRIVCGCGCGWTMKKACSVYGKVRFA